MKFSNFRFVPRDQDELDTRPRPLEPAA